MPVDYDALAAQHGGTAVVDYDALAAQHGGTPSEQPQEGFVRSLADTLGIPKETPTLKEAVTTGLAGPAGTLAKSLYEQGRASFDQLRQANQARKEGNTSGVIQHGVSAIPIVGPALNKMVDQTPTPKPGESYLRQVGDVLTSPGAMGTGAGTALQLAPVALGAVDSALPGRTPIPNPSAAPIAEAAQQAKAKLYPTAQSIPQQTIAARNLAKALVIDPNGARNFIRAATDEAGTVVDFAQKNQIPINSKVDFANAAKQAADAVQSHFNSAILEPNAKTVTSVPANYRGAKVGEGLNATLGEINSRIDDINQELNPNFRKGLASQTSAANISDGDLIAEKRALTNLLHNKLAKATGLTPEDIASVRQQAGKLRTIADEADLSANRDLTSAGRQAAGGTSPSSLGTKTGIADRVWQWAQGGAEVMGNRELNDAMTRIRPQPLNLPQPKPQFKVNIPRVPLHDRPAI